MTIFLKNILLNEHNHNEHKFKNQMIYLKSLILALVFLISSSSTFAQLIGNSKDKKYLLASFKSLGSEEKETIGNIFDTKMYFRLDSTTMQLTMFIEHLTNSEFIVAKLTNNDFIDLFENQNDESKLNFIKFTHFDVDFIKSPWDNIGLKKGFFHFTTINDSPRRCVAYLSLNLPEQKSLRIAGYVEDDLIELKKERENPPQKSKKKK